MLICHYIKCDILWHVPVSNATVFWIWGKDAGTPIMLVMFGFPVGCTIAPLLISPFLHPNTSPAICNASVSSSSEDFYNLTGSCHPPEEQSRIDVAFGVIGGFTFLWGVPFWVLYFARPLGRYSLWGKAKKSAKEIFKTSGMGLTKSGIVLVALLSLFFFFSMRR